MFLRGEPELLEPGDLRLGEPLEREVGERRPAPQAECLAEQAGGSARVTTLRRSPAEIE